MSFFLIRPFLWRRHRRWYGVLVMMWYHGRWLVWCPGVVWYPGRWLVWCPGMVWYHGRWLVFVRVTFINKTTGAAVLLSPTPLGAKFWRRKVHLVSSWTGRELNQAIFAFNSSSFAEPWELIACDRHCFGFKLRLLATDPEGKSFGAFLLDIGLKPKDWFCPKKGEKLDNEVENG